MREPDVQMREKLAEQDWLTTVVEQEALATSVRVTGSMIDFLKPFDVESALATLTRPEIRVVSLTVTEGGYYISPATQHFDPTHPDIAHDIRSFAAPKTAFGLIAAGLKHRRAARLPPFTVMSCDNIPGNGHVTENAVAGVAELADRRSPPGYGRTSPFRIPWSTGSGRPRVSGSARSCETNMASKTTGRCFARSSDSGWSRIISRQAGRGLRGSE